MNTITRNSKLKATILGLAYADALGAGYEFFKGTIGEDESIDFFELPKITVHKKYEWTDDTAMTYLTLLAMKHENSMELNVDYELLSNLFIDWYKGAPDKGLHTYNVLSQTEESKKTNPTESGLMAKVAKIITEANPMTAGNGGLMRIAAGVFLLKNIGTVFEEQKVMKIASDLNNLTHPHTDSERASRFYLFLLNAIIKEGEKQLNQGIRTRESFGDFVKHWLKQLEADFGNSIVEAFTADLRTYNPNRYVITTLCVALGAIYQSWDDGIPPKKHYINTIHKCIRVGDDTDTTSAVAGAMLGALYGEECLPEDIINIFGYAGENFPKVSYYDMVKTINELL